MHNDIQPANGPGAVSPFDAIRRTDEAGEFWSARDLQPIMGYTNWRQFETAIERARATAANTNANVADHFEVSLKTPAQGGPATKNYRLTRYGAYLVAMNGDPRKAEVAKAQAYFAVKTREAELGQTLQLPKSYSEALRELARTVDERDAAQEYAKELEPKAEYVDKFVSSDDVTTFRNAANRLGIKERALRELLTEKGWIYKTTIGTRWSKSKQALVEEHEWRAYADRMELFRLFPQHGAPRHHNNQVRQTLYITPRGLVEIEHLVGNQKALHTVDTLVGGAR